MVLRYALAFVGIILNMSAFGLTYQKAYQILSTANISSTSSNHGVLCEVLATEKVKEMYPWAVVTSGISYSLNGQTKGELDVIAFDPDSRQAFLIIEVKCSKQFSSAANKADEQLERFAEVAGDCRYRYWNKVANYNCKDFQFNDISYKKMSYEDALGYFDLSFDLTRSEILKLIDSL